MKIAAVACFSNELAIASAFRDQLETFFDKSYLFSHNSYDKTEELFLNSERFAVTKVKDKVFRQAELVRNGLVKALEEGADWVVLLDFDEFLPFENRDQLEDFLTLHNEMDVIYWSWQNIFPHKLGHQNLFNEPFLTIADNPSFMKIIVSKRAYEKDPDFVVTHGSHALNSDQKIKLHNETLLKLIHIPIHGEEHFKQKIMQRVIMEGASGFFRDCIDTYISTGSLDEGQLQDYALNYWTETRSKNIPTVFEFKFPYIKSQYMDEKQSALESLFALTYDYVVNRKDSNSILIEQQIYAEQLAARAIIQSRSWKITKPLRALNRLLKKVKSLKI